MEGKSYGSRNKLRNLEVPLEYYQKFQEPYLGDKQVFKKLLNGLSTHKYRESAERWCLKYSE